MAVFLVYLVMASQFESLLQPLIILISIPLGFLGALAGLQALQVSLSVVVFIGLIVLAGIAVNNAIILVDTTNQLFRKGANLHNAIIEAADQRLRPILMTVMTTVLGLLPMAIASGPGEEIRKPLAMTVILGLTVSTFLTLLLIPTIYAIISSSSHAFKNRHRGLNGNGTNLYPSSSTMGPPETGHSPDELSVYCRSRFLLIVATAARICSGDVRLLDVAQCSLSEFNSG